MYVLFLSFLRITLHMRHSSEQPNRSFLLPIIERSNDSNFFRSCFILVLLILPVYALYKASSGVNDDSSNATCIGILLVATLVFSAVLSLFTKAKRHEILGASAA